MLALEPADTKYSVVPGAGFANTTLEVLAVAGAPHAAGLTARLCAEHKACTFWKVAASSYEGRFAMHYDDTQRTSIAVQRIRLVGRDGDAGVFQCDDVTEDRLLYTYA